MIKKAISDDESVKNRRAAMYINRVGGEEGREGGRSTKLCIEHAVPAVFKAGLKICTARLNRCTT